MFIDRFWQEDYDQEPEEVEGELKPEINEYMPDEDDDGATRGSIFFYISKNTLWKEDQRNPSEAESYVVETANKLLDQMGDPDMEVEDYSDYHEDGVAIPVRRKGTEEVLIPFLLTWRKDAPPRTP